MDKSHASSDLAALRALIDDTDLGILTLVDRRLAAVAEVRGLKGKDGHASPVRPAREAEVIRRLAQTKREHVSLETLVRLWRCLISAATAMQGPVRIHIGRDIDRHGEWRDVVGMHFAGLPIHVHADEKAVVDVVADHPADLAVVATDGRWAASFITALTRNLAVIGRLPFLAREGRPPLLVLGHAVSEASGDDETLVVVEKGSAPPEGRRLWSASGGDVDLVALDGYLDLGGKTNGGARIAGRYPRPLGLTP
jgi:chorismate mutase